MQCLLKQRTNINWVVSRQKCLWEAFERCMARHERDLAYHERGLSIVKVVLAIME